MNVNRVLAKLSNVCNYGSNQLAFHTSKSVSVRTKNEKNETIKLLYPTPVVLYGNKIHEFMETHFSDEPFYQMFNIHTSNFYKDKHNAILETLRHNVSVAAIDCPSGKLIGVSLNGILFEKDLDRPLKIHDSTLAMISKIILDLNKECNVFEKFNITEVFECRALAVHKDYRGKGLGAKIFKRSEEEAKKAGFKLMKTEATSAYTYKMLQKMNHKVILERKYTDLLTEERVGVKIKSVPEHTHIRLMAKELASCNDP